MDAVAIIPNFDSDEWKRVEGEHVKRALRLKFDQHQNMLATLRDTGDAVIAYCNYYDKEWGTGISIDDVELKNTSAWPGKNRLGRMLMEIRSGF